MLPSSSSFRNPACKFPCTGLAPQEPVLRHRVVLVHVSHNPPETIQVTSNVSIGVPITGYSKDSFLKPSYVSFWNIPLNAIPIYHTPFVLFNVFTHHLTSPPVKISQYVSFVETCLGSQHPFGSGISIVHMLL